MALSLFSEPVRAWFEASFPEPTPAQRQGWPAIASGAHTLILAPTGSGKTLTAFLWGLDRLVTEAVPDDKAKRTRLLYISPLRALAVDVEKNLRAPLQGIRLAAERLGTSHHIHLPSVGMRTGDTPANERRSLVRTPPDLLITTPESLYLMLTSKARETLANVDAVIIDEIHALAATKRGAHLALTLERLEEVCERPPQRIGLSATQRPLEEVARFLGGFEAPGRPRPVTIVDAGVRKELEIEVVVPVDDMGALGEIIEAPAAGPAAAGPARRSIWPAIHPKLLELVQAHRSTLIFVNARRLSERLATRLNELAWEGENRGAEADGRPPVPNLAATIDVGVGPPEGFELVKAHHGSLSRERRLQIEDELKSGRLRGLVATSSLELGIDMGAVDLVIQVESPGSVASGMQRIGRAGHQVGEPSKGKLFPKHRSDLVETAVVVDRMQRGQIEATRYPRNPLDVLAQHIVAMCAMDDWPVDELSAVVRRAANFADLSDDVLTNVLDLLAGRYPSEEFAELRPRIVWDRITGVLRGRAGAQRLAVTSGGTIPDRGLFGVFLPDGTRVGELDEEMVYESRPGETFLLGASTWRIEDITFERVIVTPAPGEPGKMPFWHGDGPGRPLELGRAIGEFTRGIRSVPADEALVTLAERHGLDELAAVNLLAYLDEQAEATGAVPDDRTIVIERFRDEIGDFRVCILTPFGAPVHAPWAMALQARLGERYGLDVEVVWSDDGIVLRLPDTFDSDQGRATAIPVDEVLIDPDDIDELVLANLPATSMFASRFRECAARALLLPRRRPDRRTPLWQQRQRAADLLSVAAKYPEFPILLEATRECVNDVFDLGALREVLGDVRSRKVRVVPVDTERASPFAQSLLFQWIAVYMYEGDAPLAERRAAALALDRDLLRDLLGAEELRDLLDGAVLAELELELQRLVEGRRARDPDELHDLLRRLGPLDRDELVARADADAAAVDRWIADLLGARRAYPAAIAGADRLAATDDAARLRDALGVSVPMGLPTAFTDPVPDPLGDLVTRYARTHGPFLSAELSARLGVAPERLAAVLERMEAEERLVLGEFRPDGHTREWCDPDVLRQLRRRSLSVLRREVEPVDAEALARFLPEWHRIGTVRRGLDALAETLDTLQGAAIPASVLETDVLPLRVTGYRPTDLDELCTAGEVVWTGAGSIGPSDGRVRLFYRDQVALLAPTPDPESLPAGAAHDAVRELLAARGASFWSELVAAVAATGGPSDDQAVLAVLWDLVWSGEVTNDTLAPLRALVASKAGTRRGGAAKGAARGRARSRPRPGRLSRLGPPAGAGRWSLVGPLLLPRPTPTEAAHTRALQLLDRHGVLTREAALAEGVEGGFAGVYTILRALEERGEVRRGYFVAGLGGAQFALPGAVDRLRAFREVDRPPPAAGNDPWDEPGVVAAPAPALVLAATDPAQPYGAALPWPDSTGRPARAAGAMVVVGDGAPLVYLERGGRSLVTFEPGREQPRRWADALTRLVKDGRVGKLELATIDGTPTAETPWQGPLLAAGFQQGYRGLVLRG